MTRPSNRRSSGVVLRWLAGDTRFTIVSNNCWGAHVYQALGVEYATPFVGLFVPPRSYLHLLRQFDACIASELTFVTRSGLEAINSWRDRLPHLYPIGLLDGQAEVHFLHYRGEADARTTWDRRRRRMTTDPQRRFFKFDDRDGATTDEIHEFSHLPLPNKVCFTATSHASNTVIVPGGPGDMHVVDGEKLSRISRRHFNALRWVSTRPSWVPIPSLI
jgi:uncharacterized protein (DUF1919 family)